MLFYTVFICLLDTICPILLSSVVMKEIKPKLESEKTRGPINTQH